MTGSLIDAVRNRHQTPEGRIPHELHDFLHEFGSVPSALLHAVIFVPTFVEVEGSILIASFSSDVCARFLSKKADGRFSIIELEASFNFIEVPYMFSNRESTEEEDILLAETIADAWRGRLSLLYPGRTFSVNVLPPEETGSVVGVQFFELR